MLQGQIALVTGASRGIGRAIALELGARGATVIGTATRRTVPPTSRWDSTPPASPAWAQCWMSPTPPPAATLLAEIEKKYGAVSVLVNNAGITRDNLAMRMKDEEWDAVIDTNLKAVFRLSKLVMRGNDEGALRPHHQHHLGGRRGRQSRAGQLCRRQGRRGGHVAGFGAGTGQPQHHRQLRRARLHRYRHDHARWPMRSAMRCWGRFRWADWAGRRSRRMPWPSWPVARGRLYHRRDAACQWRHVHGLIGRSIAMEPVGFLVECTGFSQHREGEHMENIEQRVKKIVAEQLGVNEADIKNESSFVDDLGADSLDTVELVMALEEEFECEIPDEEAEKITNVQQAIDYVNDPRQVIRFTASSGAPVLTTSQSRRHRPGHRFAGRQYRRGSLGQPSSPAGAASRPITRFDAAALTARIAGEVKNFDVTAYLAPKEARRMDTFIHFGMAAGIQAFRDSGLDGDGGERRAHRREHRLRHRRSADDRGYPQRLPRQAARARFRPSSFRARSST